MLCWVTHKKTGCALPAWGLYVMLKTLECKIPCVTKLLQKFWHWIDSLEWTKQYLKNMWIGAWNVGSLYRECLKRTWPITNVYISKANLGVVSNQMSFNRDKYRLLLQVLHVCKTSNIVNIQHLFKLLSRPTQHIHIQFTKCFWKW